MFESETSSSSRGTGNNFLAADQEVESLQGDSESADRSNERFYRESRYTVSVAETTDQLNENEVSELGLLDVKRSTQVTDPISNTSHFTKKRSNALRQVNEQLETSLTDTKNTLKRIMKELTILQDVANTVEKQWAPLQLAEHKEAARLDELQEEVDGATTIGSFMAGVRKT